MKTLLMVALCTASLLAGCDRSAAPAAKGGGPGSARTAEGASGRDAVVERVTNFTDVTQAFVEFPRLVAGVPSTFAIHLTRLAGHQPLAAGKVTVVVSGAGLPQSRHSTDAASRPGIFQVQVVPGEAGDIALSVEVTTPDLSAHHRLGTVTVYPDSRTAAAAPAPRVAEGVGFTMEQQWKVDFATAEVTRRPVRATIAATGFLRARPDGEAQVTAPVAGGVNVSGPFPRIGQRVAKGEILALLAPRLGGETDLASLRAEVNKSRIELDLARRERSRIEALFRDEAVPERRLLAARAAEASIGATVEAAEGRLAQYAGSGGVPLRAPVAGVIADVRIAPGGFAHEGDLLFHVVDRRVLWLDLRVPEADSARLVRPSGASFRVEGIDRSFEIVAGRSARLVAIGGAIDPTTRTLPVVFEFTLPDERLRLGMAARAQVFTGPARDALAVPASAVLDEAGVATVFVVAGGETFERRQVRVGGRDGDWVEVLEGLEPGQRVVSRGAWLVKLAGSRTGEIGHGHTH